MEPGASGLSPPESCSYGPCQAAPYPPCCVGVCASVISFSVSVVLMFVLVLSCVDVGASVCVQSSLLILLGSFSDVSSSSVSPVCLQAIFIFPTFPGLFFWFVSSCAR